MAKYTPLYGDDLPSLKGHYSSFMDVLRVTHAKYRQAKKLSRVVTYAGQYSHKANGIGCAIGCHLPPDLADEMDTFAMSIDGFFARDDEYGQRGDQIALIRMRLEEVFDVTAIGLNNLLRLQITHDASDNVAEFRRRLLRLLELERNASMSDRS